MQLFTNLIAIMLLSWYHEANKLKGDKQMNEVGIEIDEELMFNDIIGGKTNDIAIGYVYLNDNDDKRMAVFYRLKEGVLFKDGQRFSSMVDKPHYKHLLATLINVCDSIDRKLDLI